MVYPLIIGGAEAGKLTVSSEGLFTIFEAEAKAEGLVRLSVFGGGETVYLGVMQPWEGGLYLRRKFSRAELRSFPREIEYAAPEDELQSPEKRTAELEALAAVAEEDTLQAQKEGKAPQSAPVDEAPPTAADDGDILWFTRPDGTLVRFDGERSVIAIPAELRRQTPGAVLRIINGRSYMLFKY